MNMDGSNASLDSTGKRKSFRRLCERFSEKTSLQGIGYINSARLLGAKIVWVILLLGAIGGMIFHLYFLFDQFFAWPVLTKLSLGFSNLEMPAITICNSNALKRSGLSLMDNRLQQFVTQIDQAITPNNGRRKKRFSGGITGVNSSGYEESIDLPSNSNKPPKNKLKQISSIFQSLYMDNTRSKRFQSGHLLSDMLLSCAFDGRDCSSSNFTRYQTAEYGNCFTLEAENFVATSPGPEYGLSVILYMQNEEYIHGITQGYGARITVHQKDTIPFPADNGFYASTSFETSIGLKLVDITRQPTPYGKCNLGADFKAMYNQTYNRQSCLVICEQNAILSACSCFSEDKDELFVIANLLDNRPCRTVEEKTCQATVEEEYAQKAISCSCDEPCGEQVFVKSISSRQWPSEDYAVALEQSICEKPRLAAECAKLKTLDKRQLSLNFLKLDIFYESLNYEVVEETPEIETAQFASDVGGALGLWIGLSILSIFELIQLFVECCDYAHHRCTKRDAYRERQKEAYRRNHREPGNPKMGFDKDRRMEQYTSERPHGDSSDTGSRHHDLGRSYPTSGDYGERDRNYPRSGEYDDIGNGGEGGRYGNPQSMYVYRGQRS
ncbi:degenerin deg-1-like [Mizuhopecten yessoensis]|uniref:Degenerin-like protein unc-105 n=1 Tax=Mizuhopecten yessoensis TaxID=6573 RepID=A0A210PE87_MIZYE|nr:degenerin deg-1-like [Mizuhopecten yessoensis]OWF34802.1 Degenerin-like protein unc-105 [Mizuhopecten yessoensis]